MFLFICMTNLQLLIARSIIEKEQLKKVDVLFIGDVDNVKKSVLFKKNSAVMSALRHRPAGSKIFDI